MFTSTEDARSDLFLSGAVYVIGPAVFDILRSLVPVDRIPGVTILLGLLIPVATTALVPYLLMRYRNEAFGQYGYGAGLPPNFGVGLLLALPLITASMLTGLVVGGNPLNGLGLVAVPGGEALTLIARLLSWVGLGFLAVYATVKARDAFRSDYRTVRDETIGLGRILAVVAAVAISVALLFTAPGTGGLGGGAQVFALLGLLPLGVAASVALVLWLIRGPSATSRATMVTPVVIMALGPLQLSFNLQTLALTVRQAVVYAGIGLVIAALQESRRSAVATLGLTLAIALLTTI
jgi:hypothetical protein